MLRPEQRLAIYMEGATTVSEGKMGFGILRYSPNPVVCVIDSQQAGKDMAQIARMPRSCRVVADVDEAKEMGAEVLVLGIAPAGGQIPPEWLPSIDRAAEHGMSIVNGLHDLLVPRYPHLCPGQWVWDIRVEPADVSVATGKAAALPNRRVLMVGTDMAVGKMTAGLEIHRAALATGVKAAFVATGQIGITIMGRGVPLDAVRVDYACGAIEQEVLKASGPSETGPPSLVIVEGQGALCHPASTSTLPLLRGACPTHLILCHRAGQTRLKRLPDFRIPPLLDYIRLYEDLAEACGTFPRPVTAGIALNTFHIDDDAEARAATARVEAETGLPCTDPVRFGSSRLLSALLG